MSANVDGVVRVAANRLKIVAAVEAARALALRRGRLNLRLGRLQQRRRDVRDVVQARSAGFEFLASINWNSIFLLLIIL